MKDFITFLASGESVKATSLVEKALKAKVLSAINETKKHVASETYGEISEEKKKTYCSKPNCQKKNIPHVHPDDKLHPHGLTMGAAERLYGPESDYKRTKWVDEAESPADYMKRKMTKDSSKPAKSAHKFGDYKPSKKDWNSDERMPWPKDYFSGTVKRRSSVSESFDKIEHGDHVTIRVPAGKGMKGQEWKEAKGKAVMKGPAGWVLNMGGKHGTPGIASQDNFVKLRKAKTKAPNSLGMKRLVGEGVEALAEAVPYPATSKHLKDYKKNASTGKFEHSDGHTISKDGSNFVHTTKGGKPKTFKTMNDLATHVMKVHNNFDGQVADYMKAHAGTGIDHMRLQRKMGAVDYAHKKAGGHDNPNHEEDAIKYKAMHTALMKLSKKDRGVK